MAARDQIKDSKPTEENYLKLKRLALEKAVGDLTDEPVDLDEEESKLRKKSTDAQEEYGATSGTTTFLEYRVKFLENQKKRL